MAATKVTNPLQEHPLLRTLRAGGTQAKVFCGYVGHSDSGDHILLYPSLYDLSQCFEIPRAGVLHSEEAPSQLLPFGGSVLWVKSDAAVVRRRQENASEVQGMPEVSPSEGRLRITRRARRMDLADDCHSPCNPCHSPCGTCTSRCHAQLPQE